MKKGKWLFLIIVFFLGDFSAFVWTENRKKVLFYGGIIGIVLLGEWYIHSREWKDMKDEKEDKDRKNTTIMKPHKEGEEKNEEGGEQRKKSNGTHRKTLGNTQEAIQKYKKNKEIIAHLVNEKKQEDGKALLEALLTYRLKIFSKKNQVREKMIVADHNGDDRKGVLFNPYVTHHVAIFSELQRPNYRFNYYVQKQNKKINYIEFAIESIFNYLNNNFIIELDSGAQGNMLIFAYIMSKISCLMIDGSPVANSESEKRNDILYQCNENFDKQQKYTFSPFVNKDPYQFSLYNVIMDTEKEFAVGCFSDHSLAIINELRAIMQRCVIKVR